MKKPIVSSVSLKMEHIMIKKSNRLIYPDNFRFVAYVERKGSGIALKSDAKECRIEK